MASTAHGVLTANTVAAVAVDPGREGVVVTNRSLEGVLWVRIDGVNPTVAGAGSYSVLGARDFPLTRAQLKLGPLTVKIISDGARAYSVEAIG